MLKLIVAFLTVAGIIAPSAFAGEVTAVGSTTQITEQNAVNLGGFNDIQQNSLQVGVQEINSTSVGNGTATGIGILQQGVNQTGVNVGVGNGINQISNQLQRQNIDAIGVTPVIGQ